MTSQTASLPFCRKKAASKTRYTCPGCGVNAWGKGGLHLICADCDQSMTGGTPAEGA